MKSSASAPGFPLPADGDRTEQQWRKGSGKVNGAAAVRWSNSYELVCPLRCYLSSVFGSTDHEVITLLSSGIEQTNECDRSCARMRGGWKSSRSDTRGHLEVLPRWIAS